jgi:hypothetical protein
MVDLYGYHLKICIIYNTDIHQYTILPEASEAEISDVIELVIFLQNFINGSPFLVC